jgi:hypothetical protein
MITGCIPNTRYSITDDYITGLRWFEKGIQRNRMDNIVIAMDYWNVFFNVTVRCLGAMMINTFFILKV